MRSASDIFFYASTTSNPSVFLAPGVYSMPTGNFKNYYSNLRPTSMACALTMTFITNATTATTTDVLSFGLNDFTILEAELAPR